MQCVLLPTVIWYMFSHELNFADEIMFLNLEMFWRVFGQYVLIWGWGH